MEFEMVKVSPSSDKAEWIRTKALSWSMSLRHQPLAFRVWTLACLAGDLVEPYPTIFRGWLK